MTLKAAFTGEIMCRIMLEHERSCIFGVAPNAVHFCRVKALVLIAVGVNLVAIAAHHATFRNRMVEVIPEFGGLFAMALAA